MESETRPSESPATLVAILVAARKVGDRDLVRAMRERLESEHGVRLVFLRERHKASEPTNGE
jgi:hypothetical protein